MKQDVTFGHVQYTQEEIRILTNSLELQLGPEYVSERKGPNNAKLHYLEGWKLVNLANEQFGFNGWSSSIVNQTVDFVDCDQGKYNVGISTIVRVTLKDGSYHEDVGYGSIENCRSKAGAIEKAKKESVTDALKRAFKHFGNSLGNCLYNKDYLKKISRISAPQARALDPNSLYRQKEFRSNVSAPKTIPPPSVPTAAKVAPVPPPADVPPAAQPPQIIEKDEFMDSDDDLYMNADLECINASFLESNNGNNITDDIQNTGANNNGNSAAGNNRDERKQPNSLEFTPASKVIAPPKLQQYKLSARNSYSKRSSENAQQQQLKKSKTDEIV